jgi:hypothetical protein
LLEILTYGAIVHHNFETINDEIQKKFSTKKLQGPRLLILAPHSYWARWMTGEREPRWKNFCVLCEKLRNKSGPYKIDIQCLAFDITSTRIDMGSGGS